MKKNISINWLDFQHWTKIQGKACGDEKTLLAGLRTRYATPEQAWDNWNPRPGRTQGNYDFYEQKYQFPEGEESKAVSDSLGARYMAWIIRKAYLLGTPAQVLPEKIRRLLHFDWYNLNLKDWVAMARKMVPWATLAKLIVKSCERT